MRTTPNGWGGIGLSIRIFDLPPSKPRTVNLASSIEGQGWFLSFRVLTRYVRVTFFRGASLRPTPPGASKQKDVRYFDIHEDEELNEAQMAIWIKQVAALPGWVP